MGNFQQRITQLYEEEKDRDHRLTQGNYAARFGATRNQLKGWLSGNGEPDSEMMKKIAKSHGVSVSWLVGETQVRALPGTPPSRNIDEFLYDLPPEAVRSVEEYIELIRMKYCGKS